MSYKCNPFYICIICSYAYLKGVIPKLSFRAGLYLQLNLKKNRSFEEFRQVYEENVFNVSLWGIFSSNLDNLFCCFLLFKIGKTFEMLHLKKVKESVFIWQEIYFPNSFDRVVTKLKHNPFGTVKKGLKSFWVIRKKRRFFFHH